MQKVYCIHCILHTYVQAYRHTGIDIQAPRGPADIHTYRHEDMLTIHGTVLHSHNISLPTTLFLDLHVWFRAVLPLPHDALKEALEPLVAELLPRGADSTLACLHGYMNAWIHGCTHA
jgi:hypothetical protein